MKRLLAIFLVLTMVLPLCVVTNAAESDVGIKPFRITNSMDLETDYDNFYPKIFFWSRVGSEDYVTENSIKVSVPGVGGSNPKEIAENLKEVFDEYPDGMRSLRFGATRAAFVTLLEDQIYMEKGVKVMKEWFDEFIEYYHSIGGKIDSIVVDLEYVEGGTYYITQAAQKDAYIYKKIVDHPMYAEKIRPQLVERGFKFWPNVTDETPEIFSINEKSGSEYAQSRSIWHVVMRNYMNQCINDSMESFLKYYPDGVLTDYQSRDTYAWHKNLTDTGGLTTGGNYYTVGNVNYFNTYASRPSPGFFEESGQPVYKNVPSYNGAVYKDNPFNMVLWETIFAKNLKESAPNNRMTITVTFYNYTGRSGSYCNTPYYSEMLYHMGLLDPDPFQSYCIDTEITGRGSDINYSIGIMSEILNELTRIVGAADRKPIVVPTTWNNKFILSGMYAGGRNIWRITPDLTEGMTLEQFKVEGTKDLTFSIAGQTVTFPGGKIIEDAKITEVGTCGYWVETATDVMPVITYAENRYSEYPAFIETYESYEAGANYDVTSAFPSGCWEVKKDKNATAKITDVSGDKALAMTGTYSLKLKNVLKNITAGDTYAENQAWEIDVTVPANMGAESEIVLLNVFGTKAKAEEGGFKIAGGKVYYDQAGEYVELAGVDVSAGGKFKLQRFVDFNNADAFTSDYAVYDAEGKLLGQVKDVPMVKVELPVEKLGLSVTKIEGDAVLLDNFKMYANGLAADFELYNAKTGIEYTDLETAKDTNTAYRLSWMNGTAYEKAYSVVAAFYNGDTLVSEKVIEEIKMAPGTDAVATGIVEVAEGQSVRIYARNDSQPEPDDGNNGTTGQENPGDDTQGETPVMLIAIIAGAVVLVALIVVIIVVVGKKKTAPAAEETTEDKTEE